MTAAWSRRPERVLSHLYTATTMFRSRESLAMRVALVDDDSGLLTVLERRFDALGWEGHVLPYAADPELLSSMRLHALIVNPALTGIDYVQRVASALPGLGLIVCSPPAPVADRVRGLRAGADDWLAKPCHPEELVARVQAVLRRRRVGDLPAEQAVVVAGELEIRPDRFDGFVGERSASLSRKEFELLYELASADGRVLERDEVYQRVWGYTMVRGDRSIDVFVRKLRQKLELLSPGWRYVHTHFGVGYRFGAEPTDGPSPLDRRTAADRPSASESPPTTESPPGTKGTPGTDRPTVSRHPCAAKRPPSHGDAVVALR